MVSTLPFTSVFSHAEIQADGYEHYIFFVHGYEDVTPGSEYNIVAEQLLSGSSYMQALHHPARDYSGINWMLSAGAYHNFFTSDSLVTTNSARAIGVDFGSGVNVSRKVHYF